MRTNKKTNTPPVQLSSVLFWDVNKDEIEWKSDEKWIVERVIEFGTLDDFREIIAFYGYETVKNILLKSTRLSARDLHFCSVYFDIEQSQFACYTKKSSIPKPVRFWNP
jgi:hypothetical protein